MLRRKLGRRRLLGLWGVLQRQSDRVSRETTAQAFEAHLKEKHIPAEY
jgi:hypothetical protein